MVKLTRQIVAIYCSATGEQSLNNLLCRLRNQRLQTTCPISIQIFLLNFQVQEDQKFVSCKISSVWTDLEECTVPSCSQPRADDLQNGTSLSETLFQITDTLHVTGTLVDVILEFPHGLHGSPESVLSLCGVLAHLKEWFNASITTVIQPSFLDEFDPILADCQQQVCAFVKAKVVGCFEEFENNNEDIWRGKVSTIDKTVNRGFVFPGFVLKKGDGNHEEEDPCTWGRMLEILDEVNVSTIPAYMFTKETYTLCLRDRHPYSVAFMDQLAEDSNTGLVARLACYSKPLEESPPNPNHYLSSTTWKESIMSDIMFVQEPEEELLEGYSYVHFLITPLLSPRQPLPGEQGMKVTRLCPPEQLNGGLMNLLFENAMKPCEECTNKDVGCDELLSGLPVLDAQALEEFHRILWKKQTENLQEWIRERKQCGKGDEVKVSEVKEFFANIHADLLEKLQQHLPKFQSSSCDSSSPTDHASGALTELETNSTEWQERQLLIFCESQKRTLSRLQSTDSVVLSSPIQPVQEATSIDIKDLLRLFKPDGTATVENLSPIRKKRQGRSKKSVVPNAEDLGQETIPTYLQSCCHDIYLNKDKKGEKLESHKQKLQERYIKDETNSSCSAAFFNLGKKRKMAKSPKKGEKRPKSPVGVKKLVKSPSKTLRKSPRKNSHPRSTVTESKLRKSPRKSAPSQVTQFTNQSSPRKSNTDVSTLRRSPRKKTVSGIVLSHQRRHSLYERGIVGGNTDDTTIPKQNGSALLGTESRRTSSASHGSAETAEQQRLSRSERHKKKLLDIVGDVLQKNGVDSNSAIYKSCATRLYKVTKLYVMDLPTSQNLRQEMRRIAEGQVQHVIDVETRRQSIGGKETKGK